jgi:DNA-binding NtrC family response regulator
MKKPFTILIVDRNRHVRQFLRREMMAEGYRVRLAKNGKEALISIYTHKGLDLVILDPDLPDSDELNLLEKLQDRIPVLPVVIHTFLSEVFNNAFVLEHAAFVEKEGSNIDRLKNVVTEILKHTYPQRFDSQHDALHSIGT